MRAKVSALVKDDNPPRARVYMSWASASLLMLSLAACGGEKPVVEASPGLTPASQIAADEPFADPEPMPAPKQEVQRPRAPQPLVIGLLLPLTGSDAAAGKALLNAAMLAYFDAYDPRLIMVPFDTAGTPQGARRAFAAAQARGATAIIGPLRGQNLAALPAAEGAQAIPVLSLSNDQAAASPHRYVLGQSPADEIATVVQHAAKAGRSRFASLVPEGAYGDQVQQAYGRAIRDVGADWVAFERYPRISEQVFEPMKRLTRYDARRRAVTDEVSFLRSLGDDMTDGLADQIAAENKIPAVDFDVALVAEGSALLRTIAPLFPFYEVDKPDVQLIGTGLMNDASLTTELPLRGAWFAASPQPGFTGFAEAYEARYGEPPLRISAIAYDAVALLAALAHANQDAESLDGHSLFTPENLTRRTGFSGVSGLFRLLANGRSERMLSVFEIRAEGLVEIAPAAPAFPLE